MLSRRIYLFGAVTSLALMTAQAWSQEKAKPGVKVDDRYIKIIEAYVTKEKGWSREAYEIKFIDQTGHLRRYNILVKSDNLDLPFRGESFGIIVNAETEAVEKEYHFQ